MDTDDATLVAELRADDPELLVFLRELNKRETDAPSPEAYDDARKRLTSMALATLPRLLDLAEEALKLRAVRDAAEAVPKCLGCAACHALRAALDAAKEKP